MVSVLWVVVTILCTFAYNFCIPILALLALIKLLHPSGNYIHLVVGLEPDNGFIIINSVFLDVPLCHKSSLETFNVTIFSVWTPTCTEQLLYWVASSQVCKSAMSCTLSQQQLLLHHLKELDLLYARWSTVTTSALLHPHIHQSRTAQVVFLFVRTGVVVAEYSLVCSGSVSETVTSSCWLVSIIAKFSSLKITSLFLTTFRFVSSNSLYRSCTFEPSCESGICA